MNQESFPKPLPVDPLPLEKWLRRTDRSESGRDAFFRGRDAEFKIFRDAVLNLDGGVIGGGTLIFQGAPGAGKTALMLECMEAVRLHSTPEDPWVAVDIRPGSLVSSVDVVMLVIDALNAESERLKEISNTDAKKFKNLLDLGRKLYQELPERGIGIAGISIGEQSSSDQDAKSRLQSVFRNAVELLKNFHIVVFVDEAQNVPVKDTTKEVLDCLHNPHGDIPLLAVFFGLSDTEEILRKRDLSRLPDERVVNLERLTHEEASDAIRSAFQTYNFAGSQEDHETWIEHLAKLSQGWPQHINRVSVVASRVISENGNRIRNELLEEALKDGQQRKESYYATRLRSCSFDPGLYKKIALAANDTPNGVLSRPRLKELIVPLLEDSQTGFDDFLTNALHAGVLMETRKIPHRYWIPIPSFGEYLRNLPI